ncbi:glutamate--cysteine ligase regulatory subunit [Sitodiplosis mosellana]|uniref:glutamate--cysteine ligase regulatory subunit n=1 Tax=Sitodiplosis mosellana TaxID=263140 RepID=UPI002444112B|nr:glutamate--cysteine ligase regulatory subunit [Sitodiplosis mosellana]XP_055318476.1 glutamate--cysteine ligase regulatory subunit [Sitodiplosis mosellana]XP_055318478.1 glutamate--cysteine ligase regulatory subunit [Sitodiplosis mosellana]
MLNDKRKILVSTGNILNVNKKAGQKTNEELFDCLNLTMSDPVVDTKAGIIARSNDDLLAKVKEYERNDIKIGAKVFLNHSDPNLLHEAIDSLLQVLKIDHLDNLILGFHPLDGAKSKSNGTDKTNGYQNGSLGSSLTKESLLTWGDTATAIDELKELWQVLETYADDKRICQLGIADLDTDTLIELYTSCRVKPTISQINLSACCVVPPSMQEFCAKNEIQLLTHSDSEVLITKDSFNEINSNLLQPFTPTWTSRYQVHIKCRGVLTARGFLMGAARD